VRRPDPTLIELVDHIDEVMAAAASPDHDSGKALIGQGLQKRGQDRVVYSRRQVHVAGAVSPMLGRRAERQGGQDQRIDPGAIVDQGRRSAGEFIGEPRVEAHTQMGALLFGAAHRHDGQRAGAGSRRDLGIRQVNKTHDDLQPTAASDPRDRERRRAKRNLGAKSGASPAGYDPTRRPSSERGRREIRPGQTRPLGDTVEVRQDPIRMCPYDPDWAVSFEHERARLASVLATWLSQPLEHIGSTAVPGLVAKPIIDIVAVVEDIERAAVAEAPLRGIGWVPAPEPGDDRERKRSFCMPLVELRTHHLHMVERSSSGWRGWLAFRDYLRTHPEERREYGDLKTHLANEHGADPNQRDAYRAGKGAWIRRVTSRALSEP
jgi:GrpB-like predicted nucleotidyltransferase (UPF0157 family)